MSEDLWIWGITTLAVVSATPFVRNIVRPTSCTAYAASLRALGATVVVGIRLVKGHNHWQSSVSNFLLGLVALWQIVACKRLSALLHFRRDSHKVLLFMNIRNITIVPPLMQLSPVVLLPLGVQHASPYLVAGPTFFSAGKLGFVVCNRHVPALCLCIADASSVVGFLPP